MPRILVVVSLSLFSAISLVCGEDPPDAAINPISESIEVTDVFLSGADLQIRHVTAPGDPEKEQIVVLSDSEAENLRPRLGITDSGDTWVVWWRNGDTPEVLCRVRDYGTGFWSSESRVSPEGVNSRRPTVASDGVTTWVAFETPSASVCGIAVSATQDGPEPFPTVMTIGTTTFGFPDTLVQAEAGYVWVTWVDSPTLVRWSEYKHQLDEWTAPQSESYESGTPKDARALIRDAILGN